MGAAPSPQPPVLCHDLRDMCHDLRDGQEGQAAQCFAQLASISDDEATQALALKMKKLSTDMQQARQRQLSAPDQQIKNVLQHDQDNKLRLALGIGRSAIFVASATLYGGFVGSHLGAAQRDLTHPGAGLGAAAGAALALSALSLHTGLSAQDLTLVESGLFIGGLNGLLLNSSYSSQLYLGSEFQPDSLFGLGASLLPAALGLTTAYLFDLPEGGVRLATSLATWTAGLYFLARLTLPQNMRLLPPQIMPMGLGMAISADLVYLSALALSPLNPFELDALWAVDVGVVSGALAAYALTYNALANTRMHTATIPGGMILGGFIAYGLERIFLSGIVDDKLRHVEPLMLAIDAAQDDFGPPRDESLLLSSQQNQDAQGLAFGLRWRGDLAGLFVPGL